MNASKKLAKKAAKGGSRQQGGIYGDDIILEETDSSFIMCSSNLELDPDDFPEMEIEMDFDFLDTGLDFP